MRITDIGNYHLLYMIGSGSYGKVYRGVNRTNNDVVAVKVIERKGKNKREFEELKQEIQILKKLKHPNIIQLKDSHESDQYIFLILYYAPKDLANSLKNVGRMKYNEVRRIASEIISALTYLNDNRIVHRDLKPQNILMNYNNTIKICDFGFARKMSAATVCLHSMKGTPLYIAPEIIDSKPYGHKIDIWSLGIIIYELFTGFTPFMADNFKNLAPKIIHDKVVYPANMSIEFRELTEGMLQKNPANRYDWLDILKHPFFNPPRYPIVEAVLPPQPLQPENFFSINIQSYEVSKSAVALNNELTLAELKEYERSLKQGQSKHLKTDIVFYHQLMSLLNKNLTEPNETDRLIVACRILILLIGKVRVEYNQLDNDITRKPDLYLQTVKLLGAIDEYYCLIQLYTLCCYLLKSNFSTNIREVDIDRALDVFEASAKVLQKEDCNINLFLLVFKTVGTLAVQAAITIQESAYVFTVIGYSKLLTIMAYKYKPEKEYAVVFECLYKFIQPAKLTSVGEELKQTIVGLRNQIAVGLLGKVDQFPILSNIYSKVELEYFFKVLYGCAKSSKDFRQALLRVPELKALYELNKSYLLKINILLLKEENRQFLELDVIFGEVGANGKDLLQLLQCSLISSAMFRGQLEKSEVKAQLLLKKIGLIAAQDYDRLDEAIRILEGPVDECCSSSEHIVYIIWYCLNLWPDLLQTLVETEALSNLIKLTKSKTSMTAICLHHLLYLWERVTTVVMNYKIFDSLRHSLLVIFSYDSLGILREAAEAQQKYMISMALILMCKLIVKDEEKLNEFFAKLQTVNFYRLMFIYPLLNENQLLISLKVLMRFLKKPEGSTMDFIAVQALPRLKIFFATKNVALLERLIQLLTMIARVKQDYYPKLEVLGVVEYLPQWLSHSEVGIRVKTLNLIGNMAKYSNYFMAEFTRHGIAAAIIGTLNTSGNNHQNLVYQSIFAIGNICSFSYQPAALINPLIPYLHEALFITVEGFLCNALGTLCHLVRYGKYHIKSLSDFKILARVLQICYETKFLSVQLRCLSFIYKFTDQGGGLTTVDELKCQLARVKPLSGEAKDKLCKVQEKIK